MKKMAGLNLQTLIESERLVFIDAFSQPFDSIQFDNLPISISTPSTFTMRNPRNLERFTLSASSGSKKEASQVASSFSALFSRILSKMEGLKQR